MCEDTGPSLSSCSGIRLAERSKNYAFELDRVDNSGKSALSREAYELPAFVCESPCSSEVSVMAYESSSFEAAKCIFVAAGTFGVFPTCTCEGGEGCDHRKALTPHRRDSVRKTAELPRFSSSLTSCCCFPGAPGPASGPRQ